MSKEKDLKYIKGFSQISISGICKELKIDRGNILNGKSSEKNIKLVREKLQEKIKELDN